MKTIAWCVGLALIGGTAVSAMAQIDPFMWGGGFGHASTAEEGAARGMADVIRSSGAANLMNSEAAKNYEQARKSYIDNRMLWTNTYFDMKRVNTEARKAARAPAATQEQLVKMSSEKLPDRLAQSRLDPVTGAIGWPIALRDENFNDYREELDKLYASRSANGYLSPDQYLQIKSLTKGMLQELRQVVSKYPTSTSIEARKFIESLAYEADFDPAKN